MDIIIDNINKSFNGRKVVKNFNLKLKSREIFTLLGGSGSGKTTVLRMISGFEKPDTGIINLGENIVSSKGHNIPPENRGVGYVFQDLALFPHMTVEQNIRFALKKGDTSLDYYINLCRLENLVKSYPHQLSGGEMQRVAIGRSLAMNPDILLLDEPFNGLDVVLKEQILDDIKQIIKSHGITALFVTHNREEAFFLSDRIGVMKDGDLLQYDEPRKLYSDPCNNYVAEILGTVNKLENTGEKMWVRPEDIKVDSDGNYLVRVLSSTYISGEYKIEALIEGREYSGSKIVFSSKEEHIPNSKTFVDFSPKIYSSY